MIAFLIILLAVALVIVFLQRNRHPERARGLLVLLAIGALLLAAAGLYLNRRPRQAVHPSLWRLADAVAERMGEYLASTLPSGGVVPVLVMDAEAGFDRGRVARIQRGAGPAFQCIPHRPAFVDAVDWEADAGEGYLSGDVIEEVLRAYPDSVAIVSLHWVPFLRANERPSGAWPPVFLLEVGEEIETAEAMMDRGVIAAFALPRFVPGQGIAPRTGMSAREIFDQGYLLVTPETRE